MKEKILLVDDEVNVLQGLKRQLYRDFNVDTAISAEAGLEKVSSAGPYPVIVSDIRMPGMDGIALFGEVGRVAPETVHVALTGAADLHMVIDAINRGKLFRFLTKPCDPELLIRVLRDAIRQYRLITAERALLEKTLQGAVQVLVDILSMTQPLAFSRSLRLRYYMRQITHAIGLKTQWSFEMASMLALIGCVTMPSDVIEKAFAGETLEPDERKMFDSHPQIGSKLLSSIPRIEGVAAIIGSQNQPPSLPADQKDLREADPVTLGANILNLIVDFDLYTARMIPARTVRQQFARQPEQYSPRLLPYIESLHVPAIEKAVRVVKVGQLRSGMVLAEDVVSKNGALVVRKNQAVNETIQLRLMNFMAQNAIPSTIRVSVYLPMPPGERRFASV